MSERTALQRIGRFVYRPLYVIGQWHEEYETPFIIFELVLVLLIVIPFGSLGLEERWIEALGHWHHYLEYVAGVILFLLIASRAGIVVRRRSLGYKYAGIIRKTRDSSDADELNDRIGLLYEHVKAAPWGEAPITQPSDDIRPQQIADRIADQSATHLSVRSFFYVDEVWRARERVSLGEWFEAFPWALWRLPAKSGQEHRVAGYYSVVVPITASAGRAIRRGQMATDLAEVERDIAESFGKKRRPQRRVQLLTYLHIHLPHAKEDKLEEERLFSANIQHLAVLLHGIFGAAEGFKDRWNFDLICESANSSMGSLLARLGFSELAHLAHVQSEGPVRPARSYAGFPLFEFKIDAGQPAPESDSANVREFLELLENRVEAYADTQDGGEPKKRRPKD